MTQHEVARTLVKSAPELWEVCSDPDSLSRHLHAFGEIRITRVEPETTVAWEGERASGTVRIEPSGWGTRVILTATPVGVTVPEPAIEPRAPVDPPVVEVPTAEQPVEEEPVEEERAAEEPRLESVPQREPQLDRASTPQPGFFRRLGALLFRSFVTPVELPEGAFDAVQEADQSPVAAEPIAVPEPVTPAEPEFEPEPEPEPQLAPAVVTTPVAPARSEPDLDPATVLATVLDRLGSDHHRPFSRG